jgi:hypothetical protein
VVESRGPRSANASRRAARSETKSEPAFRLCTGKHRSIISYCQRESHLAYGPRQSAGGRAWLRARISGGPKARAPVSWSAGNGENTPGSGAATRLAGARLRGTVRRGDRLERWPGLSPVGRNRSKWRLRRRHQPSGPNVMFLIRSNFLECRLYLTYRSAFAVTRPGNRAIRGNRLKNMLFKGAEVLCQAKIMALRNKARSKETDRFG